MQTSKFFCTFFLTKPELTHLTTICPGYWRPPELMSKNYSHSLLHLTMQLATVTKRSSALQSVVVQCI